MVGRQPVAITQVRSFRPHGWFMLSMSHTFFFFFFFSIKIYAIDNAKDIQ